MRACLIILVMSLCINGCANVTTDSVVWRAQDVSLTDYQSLQMQDVFNASGRPISNESLAYCSKRLRQELQSQGLEIVERRAESGNPLLVQTSIEYFEYERTVIGSNINSSTAKESLVSVRVVMFDRALNRTVAEIKNVTSISSLSKFRLADRKKTLFRRIAEITANEVAKLFQPTKTE